MKIHQLYTYSPLRNFTYLVEYGEKRRFLCIDPFDAKQVIDYIANKNGHLTGVINTHEHHDHIRGNDELIGEFDCPLYAHYNAKGIIKGVTHFLNKDDRIPLEKETYLHVMDTPGHTHAHLCLLVIKKGRPFAIFSGDTLLNASVGNCHNGGDPEVLYETIAAQFQTLDENIIVYSGHDYLSNNLKFTLNLEPNNKEAHDLLQKCSSLKENEEFLKIDIKKEKQVNTFLRLDSCEIRSNFKNIIKSDKDVFLNLRKLRNNW